MENNPVHKLELTRVAIDDVDRFSEWVKGVGWDVKPIQLSAGANEISYDHFIFPEMLVAHWKSVQSMWNASAIPQGFVVLVITRAKLPAIWNGSHFPPNLMAILRPGIEHWDVLPAGWDAYEIMIAEELIHRTELFPPDCLGGQSMVTRAFLPLAEPVTGRFLQGMDAFFLQGRGTSRSPLAAVQESRFFEFIIHGLMQVVDAGLQARGSFKLRTTRRPDIVKKAKDFVCSHLDESISTDDVAQALGVSNRVLDYAFRDSLGASPYQYILTEKLHAVRRLLKSSDVSVTEACVAHGFNTPSRFTRHYKRLFAELPSATRYAGRNRAA